MINQCKDLDFPSQLSRQRRCNKHDKNMLTKLKTCSTLKDALNLEAAMDLGHNLAQVLEETTCQGRLLQLLHGARPRVPECR